MRLFRLNSGLEPLFYYGLFALGLAVPLSLFFGDGLGIGTTKGFSTALALAVLSLAVLGMTATERFRGPPLDAGLSGGPGRRLGIIGQNSHQLADIPRSYEFARPGRGAVIVAVTFRPRRSAPAAIQAEKP